MSAVTTLKINCRKLNVFVARVNVESADAMMYIGIMSSAATMETRGIYFSCARKAVTTLKLNVKS